MQLGLGTVQLGQRYGVANRTGQTPPEEAAGVLACARRGGIRVLDTAARYGDSEAVLGAALEPGHPFRIVTKTPPLSGPGDGGASALRAGFERSLSLLRQERLYGLLIHSARDLLQPQGEQLWAAMTALKQQNLVEKIGVTVYSSVEIDSILERFRPDLVQAPVNVLDQRLIASGHLSRLKELSIEIHARSIFLQGLLLMEESALPPYFSAYRDKLGRVREFCRQHELTPLKMALSFVKCVPEIDIAIVGVERADQLAQVLAAFDSGAPAATGYASLACDDERLVNPSLWQV